MDKTLEEYSEALIEEIETKITYMKVVKDEYFRKKDFEQGNVMVEKIMTAEEIINIIKRFRME